MEAGGHGREERSMVAIKVWLSHKWLSQSVCWMVLVVIDAFEHVIKCPEA
jgi:hypothetical protein